MRRQFKESLPLAQGLKDQMKFQIFKIANAAVDEFAGTRASAGRKVTRLKKHHLHSPTGRIPRHTHDASLFIRPEELRASFSRAGLEVKEIRGLSPVGNPLRNLVAAIRNTPLRFAITDDTSVSYLGHAVKI